MDNAVCRAPLNRVIGNFRLSYFTSEVTGSTLAKKFPKVEVFSEYSGCLPQGKLTGGLGNTDPQYNWLTLLWWLCPCGDTNNIKMENEGHHFRIVLHAALTPFLLITRRSTGNPGPFTEMINWISDVIRSTYMSTSPAMIVSKKKCIGCGRLESDLLWIPFTRYVSYRCLQYKHTPNLYYFLVVICETRQNILTQKSLWTLYKLACG